VMSASGEHAPRDRIESGWPWSPYATLEEVRDTARDVLKDDRVLRVTIVEDALPPRFVEWVNR
jgi:hypothetical protein